MEDNELLYLANEKNDDAINELFAKYNGFVYHKAIKYMISEQYKDDFINEAILCFYEVVYSYTDKENTKFITYLNSCLERRMINFRKRNLRNKHSPLNNAVSLDGIEEFEQVNTNNNPDLIIMDNYLYEKLKKKILNKLNNREELVFILKEQNFSTKEIADIIDLKYADIYNIIKTIRNKVRKIMSN